MMIAMCGIAGLFAKDPSTEHELGALLAGMLVELSDRGPDSAGFAIYRDPVPSGWSKISVRGRDTTIDWTAVVADLAGRFDDAEALESSDRHAILSVSGEPAEVGSWLRDRRPDIEVLSTGQAIELFKQAGLPEDVVRQFDLAGRSGSHALGHTRMATESRVTTSHSHPFSTGPDLCLVHNGSLSNHNRLRQALRRTGIEFQTDNDSEVAAGYLTARLQAGATLEQALNGCLQDLDGFYTFAVGTRDGFAVLRDPIACKPAVLAETDDWVAMASEYRAIAHLPGAERATVWEPSPGQVYLWERERVA
jgi:glutamate synthase domain-containing protein 1